MVRGREPGTLKKGAEAAAGAASVVLKDTFGPMGDDIGALQTLGPATMIGMDKGFPATALGDPNGGGRIPLKGDCGRGFAPWAPHKTGDVGGGEFLSC